MGRDDIVDHGGGVGRDGRNLVPCQLSRAELTAMLATTRAS